MSGLRSFVWVSWLAVLAQGATAATIWSEAVNGDLSGDRLAPTSLGVLAPGTSSILGSTTTGDLDYFTFTIPAGASFTELRLAAYGATNPAFIAIQTGAVFTEAPTTVNPANLLGYMHPGAPHVGTDVLDNLAASNLLFPAAQGFDVPLGPGSYVFWVQQTNPTPTSYTWDVVVVPEPTTVALLGLGLGLLPLVRRRSAGR